MNGKIFLYTEPSLSLIDYLRQSLSAVTNAGFYGEVGVIHL